MNLRRCAVSLLVAMVTLVAVAPSAFAHTELSSSDPAEGAALPAAPTQIRLTFEESVTLPADPLNVSGPEGVTWALGPVTVSGAVVTAPVVRASGPSGQYTINYRILSTDGDPASGTVRFSLTAPATTTTTTTTTSQPAATSPAPAPTTSPAAGPAEDSGGIPVWVWFAGAVVLVILILGVAVRSRGSSGSDKS
jgi:methionine-rich copper-binding protein CopC